MTNTSRDSDLPQKLADEFNRIIRDSRSPVFWLRSPDQSEVIVRRRHYRVTPLPPFSSDVGRPGARLFNGKQGTVDSTVT